MARQDGPGEDGKPALPRWRYPFFALVLVAVVGGSKWLDIPLGLSVPIAVGCLIALANGDLPTWFGKGK